MADAFGIAATAVEVGADAATAVEVGADAPPGEDKGDGNVSPTPTGDSAMFMQ